MEISGKEAKSVLNFLGRDFDEIILLVTEKSITINEIHPSRKYLCYVSIPWKSKLEVCGRYEVDALSILKFARRIYQEDAISFSISSDLLTILLKNKRLEGQIIESIPMRKLGESNIMMMQEFQEKFKPYSEGIIDAVSLKRVLAWMQGKVVEIYSTREFINLSDRDNLKEGNLKSHAPITREGKSVHVEADVIYRLVMDIPKGNIVLRITSQKEENPLFAEWRFPSGIHCGWCLTPFDPRGWVDEEKELKVKVK